MDCVCGGAFGGALARIVLSPIVWVCVSACACVCVLLALFVFVFDGVVYVSIFSLSFYTHA